MDQRLEAAIILIMGLDPTRPQRRRPFDLLYVAAGLLVVVLLLAWAFLG